MRARSAARRVVARSLARAARGSRTARRAATRRAAQRVLRVCADPEQPAVLQRAAARDSRTSIAELIARRARRAARLHLVGAAARLRPQHAQGRDCATSCIGVPARLRAWRADHAPVLPLDLRLRHARDRHARRRLASTIPRLRDAEDRRAADRRRRRQHAAGARARRSAASSRTSRGYTVYGDYAQPNPPARIVEAVAKGESTSRWSGGRWPATSRARQTVPLRRRAGRRRRSTAPCLPFVFDIAMGVRRGDDALRGRARRDPRAPQSRDRRHPRRLRRAARSTQPTDASRGSAMTATRRRSRLRWPWRSPAASARSAASARLADASATQPVALVPLSAGLRPARRASVSGKAQRLRGQRLRHLQGKRLFSWYNCIGCHANGGGGIGPPLMDDEWIYGSRPRTSSPRSSRAGRTACRRSRQDPRRPDLAARRLRALA